MNNVDYFIYTLNQSRNPRETEREVGTKIKHGRQRLKESDTKGRKKRLIQGKEGTERERRQRVREKQKRRGGNT